MRVNEEEGKRRVLKLSNGPETEHKTKTQLMLEYYDTPARWGITSEYTWLTSRDRGYLQSSVFPFDWADMMVSSSYFDSKEQMITYCQTSFKQIEEYCQRLWSKSFSECYDLLSMKARHDGIGMFKDYASKGHSTAMAMLGHSIMKLDSDGKDKEIRVTLVNDIEDKGKNG